MKPQQKAAAIISSSPGRPEKLPTAGLARILLLRGKSKNRTAKNRARSGPVLISARSKSVRRSSEEDGGVAGKEGRAGEPTSPKVTCIGQVRIRNKNKKNRNKIKKSPSSSSLPLTSSPSPALIALKCNFCCCCCCNICPRKQTKQSASRSDRCRFLCWRRRRKKKKAEEDEDRSSRAEHVPPIAFVREVKMRSESGSTDLDGEKSTDDDEEETKVFVTSSSSPPKNALLLMRCRSAPHNRSSALATCRFVVAPAPGSEREGEAEEVVVIEKEEEEEVVVEEKRREVEPEKLRELQRAVSLMRCNSEPAKKGERLMEVASYGKLDGSGGGSGGSGGKERGEVRSSPPPTPALLQ